MGEDTVSDVVVFLNYGFQKADQQMRYASPPIRHRYELASDLWIGPLGSTDSPVIIRACDPPGFNIEKIEKICPPIELYSFVRENPPRRTEQGHEGWDEDRRLATCIALSRLVHPTTVGYHYAARVFRGPCGEIMQVRYGTLGGMRDFGYVANELRNWLTVEDAKQLKALVGKWPTTGLHGPVARALRYCDLAAYQDEIGPRWTLVAIGIEALIHTQRERSTAQFVKRVPCLADEVGCGPITEKEAEDMYDFRSGLAHGKRLNEAPDTLKYLYTKMECVLRLAVKRAILDDNFGQFLADPIQVERKWPI